MHSDISSHDICWDKTTSGHTSILVSKNETFIGEVQLQSQCDFHSFPNFVAV